MSSTESLSHGKRGRCGSAFQQLPIVHTTSTSQPDGGSMGCYGSIAVVFCFIVVCMTFPFSLIFCLKIVTEYERVVIFRLGRTIRGGSRGPGVFFFLPCIDKYDIVDLRTVSFDVPPQECLTRDSVTVTVDAVVFFRIENATVSITNVKDAQASTRLLSQTTLRNMIGTRILSDILTNREDISLQMQSILDEATAPWGVHVERVEMKDVRLPIQLQRAMAAEAEATREAKAKLICANGEKQASVALKAAADTMHDSPEAMQLRYLQTLNTISAEKNSTIVLPIPVDFISRYIP